MPNPVLATDLSLDPLLLELQRSNEELRLARDEAQGANRAKSEFLANMSHELRTPLNSVIGFASVLLKNKSGALPPQELAYLHRIQDNGRHLLSLINNILDLSKVEAGKVELELADVPLESLVKETLAELEGGIGSGGPKLIAQVPRGMQPFRTDKGRLKQVLINLVGNAIKFTPAGSVTVWVAPDDEGRAVRIDVIDTGIGIPAERQAAVFEAFQQADSSTSRVYGGTGLGLAITRSLLQLLGCRVSLTSEPGEGSTFSVHLVPTSVPAAPVLVAVAA